MSAIYPPTLQWGRDVSVAEVNLDANKVAKAL